MKWKLKTTLSTTKVKHHTITSLWWKCVFWFHRVVVKCVWMLSLFYLCYAFSVIFSSVHHSRSFARFMDISNRSSSRQTGSKSASGCLVSYIYKKWSHKTHITAVLGSIKGINYRMLHMQSIWPDTNDIFVILCIKEEDALDAHAFKYIPVAFWLCISIWCHCVTLGH